MAIYEIPLSAKPQAFAITLGTTDYRMRLTYCDAVEGGWILDIGDANGVPLVCGIPLVTGLDLLAQYRYLGIRGRLFVSSSGGKGPFAVDGKITSSQPIGGSVLAGVLGGGIGALMGMMITAALLASPMAQTPGSGFHTARYALASLWGQP